MKIIILGAGQVGSSVAANLVNEDNDITLVDINPSALQSISERFDLRTITGVASHPSVLEKAGARDAEMILAVKKCDEVNMIACQVAYTLFHTPTKIARIREIEYLKNHPLFAQEALPVDVLISPDRLVTEQIQQLIKHPGALQVLDFADGKAQMVVIRASYSGVLEGLSLRELKEKLKNINIEYKIAIIYSKGKPIIPNADTVIKADDEIFFISSQKSMDNLLQHIRIKDKP
ncbi:MAG: NAD-binding protein, partial [Pseudomonadota bacterium]|nr:NAD-binding protein [Pseudomonadota bacterium]